MTAEYAVLCLVLAPALIFMLVLSKDVYTRQLQTWTDLEVLLVDDGSTDDSAGICRSFCEKDSRFRLLQTENGGVSSARNLGLKEASGDYIAFVDADDWLCPEMLATTDIPSFNLNTSFAA